MSQHPLASEDPPIHNKDFRDTIIKSGFSGVAATVLAVTIWSPAGFGGIIGTSLASGFGFGPDANVNSATSGLPAFPAPVTKAELTEIRDRLAITTATLANVRAATDTEIEYVRTIARNGGLLSAAPMPHVAQVGAGMQVTQRAEEPATVRAVSAVSTEAQIAPLQTAQLEPAGEIVPVSFGGGVDYGMRDSDLELASLLLSDDYR